MWVLFLNRYSFKGRRGVAFGAWHIISYNNCTPLDKNNSKGFCYYYTRLDLRSIGKIDKLVDRVNELDLKQGHHLQQAVRSRSS